MENVKNIVKSIIGNDMKDFGFKAYSNMYYTVPEISRFSWALACRRKGRSV